jgi:hypothetical protein
MKLLVFFLKLLSRTSRGLPNLHTIRLDHFEDLTDQKALETSNLKQSKIVVDLKPMTLDLTNAPVCFEKIKTMLTGMCGHTGIPLAYVICNKLIPPDEQDDNPSGVDGSAYTSINEEMIAQAPILADTFKYRQSAPQEGVKRISTKGRLIVQKELLRVRS